MNNEEQILNAIKWRQYDYLDRLVSYELKEWGWSCLRKTLCTKTEKAITARLRDGLLHIMGFSTIRGIDADPLEIVKGMKTEVDSLSELRGLCFRIGESILSDMIESRNTFFLDHERMASGPFAGMIPRILEVRTSEIHELESTVSKWDIVQTAYGFSIIATGGVLTDSRSPDHQRLGDALLKVAGSLGKRIVVTSSPLRLGSEIRGFENCSEATRELLWHILRFKTYRGKQKIRQSAKYIEKHGDSRIVHLLHNYLSNSRYYYTAVKIMRALGNIGMPESAEYLSPFLERTGNWRTSAFRAISSIPGESVTDMLVERYKTGARYRYQILRTLWSRPPQEIIKHIDTLKRITDGWQRRRIDNLESRALKHIEKLVAIES